MERNMIEYSEDNLKVLFPETTGKSTVVYMCGPQGPHIAVGFQAYSEDLEIYIEREIPFDDRLEITCSIIG